MQLIPHSDGLCSRVYRSQISGRETLDGTPGWICIKRVCLEDQSRPHSIEKEVELLDLLGGHVNLVPILSIIKDESDPFETLLDLQMPLYQSTLAEVLQDPLYKVDFFSLAKQLFTGLDYIHGKGVGHRDIKPSNLLLSSDGTLKLIDFGTAIDSRRDKVFQVGTGSFRAPELLFAPTDGYDTFAIDLWAAGVVLCLFFTELKKCKSSQEEKPRWQRSLWDDAADPYSEEEEEQEQEQGPMTKSGWVRQELFDDTRGDIGLAGSIFELRGLTTDWPEAKAFQPPLERMPFPLREPQRLEIKLVGLASADEPTRTFFTEGIEKLLSLSAQKRPQASRILQLLAQS